MTAAITTPTPGGKPGAWPRVRWATQLTEADQHNRAHLRYPTMSTTPDHQMTPEHQTSTPAEDHQGNSNVKITEPITPRHHDPEEISCSVADAPSQSILPASVPSWRRAGAAATPTSPAVGLRGVSC
ncbi:MAG: hypothetical protein LC799_07480 [Actinobacteria bacterium]|nr:hypothetical protein [Actinomycetota bacterium]